MVDSNACPVYSLFWRW